MSEPILGFFGDKPIEPLKSNDEDRHLIQQLVKAHWETIDTNSRNYPIADIVTDAYEETLKLMRKKYGL